MKHRFHPTNFGEVDSGFGEFEALRVTDGLIVSLALEVRELRPLLEEVLVRFIQVLQLLLKRLGVGLL